MGFPDNILLTRHAMRFFSGELPKNIVALSSPEIMEQIESLFDGYVFSDSTIFMDLRSRIENLFFELDPLGIIEKNHNNQRDEYLVEADMVIWLFLLKKFDLHTLWAIWEFQFADSNPFAEFNDPRLEEMKEKLILILEK